MREVCKKALCPTYPYNPLSFVSQDNAVTFHIPIVLQLPHSVPVPSHHVVRCVCCDNFCCCCCSPPILYM
jgi:hypothetical protein